MSTNAWLRVILVLWVIGFLVIACGPAILGDGIGGTLFGGVVGLTLGAVLFVPWVIGVVILGALIWLTNPRRRGYPDRSDRDRYLDGRSSDDRTRR
jgi:hypothetical protein